MDILRYYRPCGARIVLRSYVLLVGVMFAGVVAADTSTQGHFPIGETIVFGAAVVSLLVYFEWGGSRIGVIETADAFVDRGGALARAHTIAKRDVLRFESVNGALGVQVAAVMKDDTRAVFRGVYQRRRFGKHSRTVEWHGGRTSDIVAEFNARLAAHPDPGGVGPRPRM